MGAEPRQLAQFLFQRREIVEGGDGAGDVTSGARRGDLLLTGFENSLGGAEPLQQQATGARSRAVNTSQGEPISVGRRGHSAPAQPPSCQKSIKLVAPLGVVVTQVANRGHRDMAGRSRSSLTGRVQ